MKSNPKNASAHRRRILIVDDDPKVLEMYSALLQEVGYEVESAENALAAVAAVVRAAPDLILADIRMPIVGGMDLVRELKSHIDSRRIPVIAFTGYNSPGMHRDALKAGYDGYLPKLTKPGLFLNRIEHLLRKFESDQTSKSAPAKPAKAPASE